MRSAYLVQRGTLQVGRVVTLQYTDQLAGRIQPIALDIFSFCCAAGHWALEYRFRHAMGSHSGLAIDRFMKSLTWTAPGDAGTPSE